MAAPEETTIAVALLPNEPLPPTCVASVPAVTLMAEMPVVAPLTVSFAAPAFVSVAVTPLSADEMIAFAVVVMDGDASAKAIVPPVTEYAESNSMLDTPTPPLTVTRPGVPPDPNFAMSVPRTVQLMFPEPVAQVGDEVLHVPAPSEPVPVDWGSHV